MISSDDLRAAELFLMNWAKRDAEFKAKDMPYKLHFKIALALAEIGKLKREHRCIFDLDPKSEEIDGSFFPSNIKIQKSAELLSAFKGVLFPSNEPPAIRGIHFNAKEQRLEATDCIVLVTHPYHIEGNNRIIDLSGVTIFPDLYFPGISRYVNRSEEGEVIDIQKLVKRLRVAKSLNTFFASERKNSREYAAVVKNKSFYNPKYIFTALTSLIRLGNSSIKFREDNLRNVIYFQGNLGSLATVMSLTHINNLATIVKLN